MPPVDAPPPRERISLAQGTLVTGHLLRLALGLGITATLGRRLSGEDFGFFSLVASLYLVGHVLLDLGAGAVAVREIAREPGRERSLLEALLGWRTRLGLVLAVLVALASLFEPRGGSRLVLFGVAASLAFLAPGILNVALQIRQAHIGITLGGILVQGLILGLCLLLPDEAMGPSLAGILILRELLGVAIVSVLGRRALGYRPRGTWRGDELRPFLAAAMTQGVAVLVQTAYFHADVFMVRWLRGEAELGDYAAAFRLVNPLLLVPGMLMVPVLPLLSRAASRTTVEGRALRDAAIGTALPLGVIAAGLVALLAPEGLAFVYGGRFEGSVVALRWLALALGAVFVAAPVGTTLLAAGGERRLLRIGLIGLMINLAGNFALIPRFGIEGAAVMTAATELVVLVLSWRAAALGVGPLLPALPGLLPAGLICGILTAFPGGGATRLAWAAALGTVGGLTLLALPAGRRFRRAAATLDHGVRDDAEGAARDAAGEDRSR